MAGDSSGLMDAARAIREAATLVATGHVKPDGDALGSALGLALAARATGRSARVCFGERFVLGRHYGFLDTRPVVGPEEAGAPDVLVAFDCNDPDRLGAELAPVVDAAGTVVMIDHHVAGPGFGDIRVSDPDAPAAALLCYRLIRMIGWEVSAEVATALLLGMVTDTGRFQYGNTNPEVLRAAAELVQAGARPEVIGQSVYESVAFGYLGVAGAVLSRATLEPAHSLVWSYLTQDDLRRHGIGMEDADALIDDIRVAREAEVALLLKEQPGGEWKLSLRSRRHVDVAAIAETMGGGGHHRAAGCSFSGTRDEAVEVVRKRLAG
ncbi:MAG: DHH family phosphoesterase [bacterium]|nr:DHH family phosphoesterase [bacterium]MDE0351953.1 DHH family phosphoesterase [bacterium]